MKTLFAALLLLAPFFVVFAAGAQTGDEQAIRAVLSVGLANSSDGFLRLRGEKLKENTFAAKSPDPAHFRSCQISYLQPPGGYSYICFSTLRSAPDLYKFANEMARVVAPLIPSGYSTKGIVDYGGGSGIVYEEWTMAGRPTITFMEYPQNNDRAEYRLFVAGAPSPK